MKRPVALVLYILSALGIIFISGTLWLARQTRETPSQIPDFHLRYRNADWDFATRLAPLNLLYAGYVKCPDACPMTLSATAQAFKSLSEDQRKKALLVFISVDTKHDTPDQVADFAAQFFPAFVGLSGSLQQIKEATDALGFSFMEEPDPKSYLGYSISHTDRVLFIDQHRQIIDSISSARSAGEIANKMRIYL